MIIASSGRTPFHAEVYISAHWVGIWQGTFSQKHFFMSVRWEVMTHELSDLSRSNNKIAHVRYWRSDVGAIYAEERDGLIKRLIHIVGF